MNNGLASLKEKTALEEKDSAQKNHEHRLIYKYYTKSFEIGKCEYGLRPNKDVETRDLAVDEKIIEDINGLFQVHGFIFFATSPIYGKPGLWAYDCGRKKMMQIIGPKTKNVDYPDGADYFQLKGVLKNKEFYLLKYIHVPDVESPEFSEEMSGRHMRNIKFYIVTEGRK